MNEYIVSFYDRNKDKVYITKYLARSLEDCKNKIMEEFQDYDSDWNDFIKEVNDEYVFSKIKDIEEL